MRDYGVKHDEWFKEWSWWQFILRFDAINEINESIEDIGSGSEKARPHSHQDTYNGEVRRTVTNVDDIIDPSKIVKGEM